jgi:hypothetical protein
MKSFFISMGERSETEEGFKVVLLTETAKALSPALPDAKDYYFSYSLISHNHWKVNELYSS